MRAKNYKHETVPVTKDTPIKRRKSLSQIPTTSNGVDEVETQDQGADMVAASGLRRNDPPSLVHEKKRKIVEVTEDAPQKPDGQKRHKRFHPDVESEPVKPRETGIALADAADPTLEPKSKGTKHSKSIKWSLSAPTGGRLISAKPRFARDEKHIILAYGTGLRIYSTSNSLLTKNLPNTSHDPVSSFALSAVDDNILYVTTAQGLIYKWDWTNGSKLGRWDLGARVTDLQVGISGSPSQMSDLVYSTERKRGKWRISVSRLMAGTERSLTESKVIYMSEFPISNLCVISGGKVVAFASGKRVYIAISNNTDGTSLSEVRYVCRELMAPEWVTCLDARRRDTSSRQPGKTKNKPKTASIEANGAIDIVVGGQSGGIYLYENLLSKLIQFEKASRPAESLQITPRRMHWHREAVETISWSLDGNYVISGGAETVLVMWQLDTNKPQFLPHLGSTIESVTISPSGVSYAIRLADNSAMALSTAELKPTAYFPGIRARSILQTFPEDNRTTIDKPDSIKSGSTGFSVQRVPAVLSPSDPSKLLAIVPSSQLQNPVDQSCYGAPFLQTYDIQADRQMGIQALSRSNTTVLNMGPGANKIGEPQVTLLQISRHGDWLATVDEWIPPISDIEHLVTQGDSTIEEQNRRREVFLKFWRWHSASQNWELVARVDSPHGSALDAEPVMGRVLDLVSNPACDEFATIGEDSTVKIWSPVRRHRDGIVVQGTTGEILTTWICKNVSHLRRGRDVLSSHVGTADIKSHTASLSYASDGSVLAAAMQEVQHSVHMINPNTGDVVQSLQGIYNRDLVSIALIDRYLVILSNDLVVWDLVQGALHFGLSLGSYDLLQEGSLPSHLAVNLEHGTFAITLPLPGKEKDHPDTSEALASRRSQLLVFDPSNPSPISSVTIPRPVTALLAIPKNPDYLVLDCTAELRVLSSTGTFSTSALNQESSTIDHLAPDFAEPPALLPALETDGITMDVTKLPEVLSVPVKDLGDKPVVRSQQLTEVFDVGPSFALPSVGELFEQVVQLFARKTEA